MSGLSPEDYPEYSQFIANKNGSRLGFGTQPALLLVDASNAYFTPGPFDLRGYDKAVAAPESMKRLLAAARAGNCPVIWTQTKYIHPELKDAGLLVKKIPGLHVFREGGSLGMNTFLDGLEPEADDIIIHKKFPSAFFGTNLLAQLHVLGADTLIIGGLCTSGSVRASSLDAMQSGLRTMVGTLALVASTD